MELALDHVERVALAGWSRALQRQAPSAGAVTAACAVRLAGESRSDARPRRVCPYELPGPSLSTPGFQEALARGSFPLSALRRERVTIHLTRAPALATDGWSGTRRPDVRIVLRRTSVTHRRFNF
jgi:hypothetical protein